MSKLRHRDKSSRELERTAIALGYTAQRTATGHLRFVHSVTGKTVIGPSKAGSGRLLRNAHAELKRGAAP